MEMHRPKKALGQNFLIDGNVIANIIRAADLSSEDMVLEIGPGKGALTSRLAEKAAQVVAVEWDGGLVSYLKDEFRAYDTVTVHHGDFLRTDLDHLLGPLRSDGWKAVANLPYNISSQILFRLIEYRKLFSELLLMLQKEVGERLIAPPSCKEYGILSVFCQLYFDIEKVMSVKPASFRPVPKVDSLVLRFRVLDAPRVFVGDERLFQVLVKAAFSQRRKTLLNCLKQLDMLTARGGLGQVFERAGIDSGRRGETLSLEEFARLTNTILSLPQ
jgi:16S rRNA (adenine1518-N6/adenine1519-N6)-dimethyltransferase